MSDLPRNRTPTFRLTSIEKPDMSPYLFHMTSSESLKSILKYENKKKDTGTLIVQIPDNSKTVNYDVPMVCFTESPPFALDFFRYRWSEEKSNLLKYGIGFDKARMVQKGVFPTFYVDRKLQSQILKLNEKFKHNNLSSKLECLSCDDKEFIQELNELLSDTSNTLSSVKRLMFPLLENNIYQGYTWEREWRYTTANDSKEFVFSYDDIRIICCVDEDEDIFKTIIGEYYIEKNKIQFIRTWKEYNEITEFLTRKTQNININKKIKETLAEKKGVEHYIKFLEKQGKKINQMKKLSESIDEDIKKIALIKVFEKVSKQITTTNNLKIKIMNNDCEIVINSIAVYQENKKSTKIKNPSNYLSAIIDKGGKPKSKQELDEVRKQMKEIIENL
jgi:hypothetical protein